MIEINGREKELSELTLKEWGLVVFALFFSFGVIAIIALAFFPFFVAVAGFMLVVALLAALAGVFASIAVGFKSLIDWFYD